MLCHGFHSPLMGFRYGSLFTDLVKVEIYMTYFCSINVLSTIDSTWSAGRKCETQIWNTSRLQVLYSNKRVSIHSWSRAGYHQEPPDKNRCRIYIYFILYWRHHYIYHYQIYTDVEYYNMRTKIYCINLGGQCKRLKSTGRCRIYV